MKPVVVTTSWDDGHKLDLKLAELLSEYEIKGTFYIAPKNRELAAANILTKAQIRNLADLFEVGSHSMTHPVLPRVSSKGLLSEIVDSRKYLSDLIGKPVDSFCYPRGQYNKAVVQQVRDAKYTFARTTKRYSTALSKNPLTSSTTLETHRNPIITTPLDFIKTTRFLSGNLLNAPATFDWELFAKRAFDLVESKGGIFHIWGHSWVIERDNAWDKLERVIAYISRKETVSYINNRELGHMEQ